MIIISSLIPAMAFSDELPMATAQHGVHANDSFSQNQSMPDQSAEAFAAFLSYLGEFEDEQGEWGEVMSLEQDDSVGGQANE